ncbi:hypothetical protein BESB_049560 [Besnoitia besnoiti]|uniref:RNA polymerase III RPC4 n=1 Tax=Besnoitia besnoiti TaxID=94643 RepID=A0A2A9MHU6_BESBE|nr:hypothetical protein BESB_049560 [Besnoitia besnoiti]PFH36764.1 hypothetical protein BESB_049560 [Besnoitia besnoiti]
MSGRPSREVNGRAPSPSSASSSRQASAPPLRGPKAEPANGGQQPRKKEHAAADCHYVRLFISIQIPFRVANTAWKKAVRSEPALQGESRMRVSISSVPRRVIWRVVAAVALRAVSSTASFVALQRRQQQLLGSASAGPPGLDPTTHGRTAPFLPSFAPSATPSPASLSRSTRPNSLTPSPRSVGPAGEAAPVSGESGLAGKSKLEDGGRAACAARKFVPNLGRGGSVAAVKKEKLADIDRCNSDLSAMVLRSLQNSESKKLGQEKPFDLAGRGGQPPAAPPPGYPGGSATPPFAKAGARRPLHLASPAAIRESNLRLLQQHQKDSKKTGKKSRRLMELSWSGAENDDRDASCMSPRGLYTPVSLPFVVREDDEDVQEGGHKRREVALADLMGEREAEDGSTGVRRKRPSARHVEEANRFAAGLLLVDEEGEERGEKARADTWDLADDDDGRGTDFLHICFPFLFPPMDRQAMEEERLAREAEREARRSVEPAADGGGDDVYGSKADDGKEGSGEAAGKASGRGAGGAKSRAKASPPLRPLGPSPPLPLPSLPEGRIGKLLVHRSGRVELRLLCAAPKSDDQGAVGGGGVGAEATRSGREATQSEGTRGAPQEAPTKQLPVEDAGVCFEVNVGSECTFAQEVGCLVEDTSEFLFLGRCNKRMVIAPDVRRCLQAATMGGVGA